eukprot:3814198-Amphidinium_carterae.1
MNTQKVVVVGSTSKFVRALLWHLLLLMCSFIVSTGRGGAYYRLTALRRCAAVHSDIVAERLSLPTAVLCHVAAKLHAGGP